MNKPRILPFRENPRLIHRTPLYEGEVKQTV